MLQIDEEDTRRMAVINTETRNMAIIWSHTYKMPIAPKPDDFVFMAGESINLWLIAVFYIMMFTYFLALLWMFTA